MAEIEGVIKDTISTIYSKPALLKMTGMADQTGKFQPVSQFEINYDAQQNQLEPIYYWILDFLEGMGLEVEKIVDNFTSSPGSGHFAEIGQRATRMQEEGMKILGGLNQTIKSALNLVYDLREFKVRLKHYDDYNNSKDKAVRDGAFLSLKQIWLDNVDLPRRGDGSIHALASKVGYTTIREAFMVARTLKDVDDMAKVKEGVINEQVARLIRPRLKEFFDWISFSESELRRRYNIEKSYLKSQIGNIKLYAAWVKPYLQAAEQLRQRGFDKHAALVNAFSTSMFQLTLLATQKKSKWENTKLQSKRGRSYGPVLIINFVYRAHLLQRVNQRGDYAAQFGGRVDMKFSAYALNNEELAFVRKKNDDADLKEALTLEGDYAVEAINELESELREFLGDDEVNRALKKEVKKTEKKTDDINPFSALWSLVSGDTKKRKKGEPITDVTQIKKDNWKERMMRIAAAQSAAGQLYAVYDIYKKAHGMASSRQEFAPQSELNEPSTYFSDVWSHDWQ